MQPREQRPDPSLLVEMFERRAAPRLLADAPDVPRRLPRDFRLDPAPQRGQPLGVDEAPQLGTALLLDLRS